MGQISKGQKVWKRKEIGIYMEKAMTDALCWLDGAIIGIITNLKRDPIFSVLQVICRKNGDSSNFSKLVMFKVFLRCDSWFANRKYQLLFGLLGIYMYVCIEFKYRCIMDFLLDIMTWWWRIVVGLFIVYAVLRYVFRDS